MAFTLAPSAIAAGYTLETFESVDSTNAIAMERAREGHRGLLWVVSDHQLAGRGRRGRPWQTERGNLAASLLLKPQVPLSSAASLGFVAGLALADALEAVVPAGSPIGVGLDGGATRDGRFELKWPNDLIAGGAKLSGILLESSMLDGNGYALVIGIGVNVVSHPTDTPYPATDLQELGASCDAETLFLALSDAWLENVSLWSEGRGTQAVRARWLGRAAGLGSEVALRADGRVVRGIFETIDEECRFVIKENDGRRLTVSAGDVHFGAVASANVS